MYPRNQTFYRTLSYVPKKTSYFFSPCGAKRPLGIQHLYLYSRVLLKLLPIGAALVLFWGLDGRRAPATAGTELSCGSVEVPTALCCEESVNLDTELLSRYTDSESQNGCKINNHKHKLLPSGWLHSFSLWDEVGEEFRRPLAQRIKWQCKSRPQMQKWAQCN